MQCSIIAEMHNVLLSFDTVHFTWTHLSAVNGVTGTPPSPREYPQMTAFRDLIVIYGGKFQNDDRSCGDASFPTDLFVFNTTSNHWTELFPTGDVPTGRYQGSLVTMRDKIFLFGGRYFSSGCHISESLYQLQFVNNGTHGWLWTRLTSNKANPGKPFPSGYFFRHAMTVAQDTAFVFGGVGRGVDLYQFEMVDGEAVLEPTFQHCANQNGICACHGTARFGHVNYAWRELAVTGNITCSKSAFENVDPAPGQPKTCQCKAHNPTLLQFKMQWTKLHYAASIGGTAPGAREVSCRHACPPPILAVVLTQAFIDPQIRNLLNLLSAGLL
jgi:hypothetical protein